MENRLILALGGRRIRQEGLEMLRKVSLLMTGALMGATAMSLLHVVPGIQAEAAGSDTYKQLSIFGDVFERVRNSYVTVPDEKELVKNAINGMLTSLDPHSSYMDEQGAKDMQVQTKGTFGGLGIEVTMENDLVKVITPIDDTPAAKAGIRSGDLIAKIDGTEVAGMTLEEAVEKMRGEVNEPIKLTIVRKGETKPLEFTVVRDVIKVKAVKFRVENDVGYMKITSFTEQAFGDLDDAIKKIEAQIPADKLKGFILDLRNNPGGLLDQAVSVSDTFLDKGEVVSTRGRDPQNITRYDSEPGDSTDGKPLIVMVNGGSASASEIVAGALQDHRRATVLGTKSFGKGSVQTIIPLGQTQGALRLTTALYYTPAGKSIQGKGIIPDILSEQPLPEELKGVDTKAAESQLKGHIKGNQEDTEGSGSNAYVPADPKDDLQLAEALKLLRGQEKNAAFPPDAAKALPN
jgi:carboxyl-terminal processing protease